MCNAPVSLPEHASSASVEVSQSRVGEECTGHENSSAGLGSQSSGEPLGFCVRFLQQVFCYANPSAEPSCRTPKVPQNSGWEGEPRPVF